MIDLHLVTWNRPKMTELVIKTIERNTKPGTYNLMIWDNTPDNIGLEAARQKLLEDTTTEFFVCIDNDCLPPPRDEHKDWLERMLELMQRYEDYAAISMRTQVMIGTGNIFEVADDKGDDLVDFPHPGGSFRMMKTAAVHQVNGWDRKAPGRGSEERYICGKLQEAGYKTAFAAQIHTLHLFGTRGVTNKTDRWGYDPNLEPGDTGHSDISHPALTNGDDYDEVLAYAGKKLTEDYFDVNHNNTKN